MQIKDWQIISNLNGKQKRRFSECYLVKHTITNERAVLKVTDQRNKIHLFNESQFHFHTPQLAQVHDYWETEETICLILKYKEGETITQHWKTLKQKDKVPFTILLLEQVTQLLQIINQLGSVHLDIKPSNLLYNSKDKTFDVIDFGLAEKLPVQNREILFPLGYAAPELILNEYDHIGLGTDLYALGATIYHLWAGEIPNSHSNPAIMTNLQLAHPISKPSRMPKELFQIMETLMHKPAWRTVPSLLTSEERKNYLTDSIKKREDLLFSLPQLLIDLQSKKSTNLFIKFFSKSNIKIEK